MAASASSIKWRSGSKPRNGTSSGKPSKAARGASPISSASATGARFDKPPTWRAAVNRAAIAAVVFGVLLVVLFKRPPGAGAVLAALMFLLYIPLGFATDTMIHRYRLRKKAQSG